jgi:hypothetical protein
LKFLKFNISINLSNFFENIKININDVVETFFGGEFSPFCKHKKGSSTSTKYSLVKIKILNYYFLNDIILQWVLKLGAEI